MAPKGPKLNKTDKYMLNKRQVNFISSFITKSYIYGCVPYQYWTYTDVNVYVFKVPINLL